jgi:hypothetical protein
MSAVRQKSLLELSIGSAAGGTNPEVRQRLEIYSSIEVNNLIGAIDLSPYALNSTVVAVSGSLSSDVVVLEAQVIEISGNVSLLSSEVVGISGDVYDLDVSLTSAVFNHIVPDGTSPSVTGTVYRWGRIDAISGGPLWIPLYA